jgi:hypothetical protein
LGKGSFAEVIEVKGFCHKPTTEDELKSRISTTWNHNGSMSLKRLAVVRLDIAIEKARYALKRLKKTVRNDPRMLLLDSSAV